MQHASIIYSQSYNEVFYLVLSLEIYSDYNYYDDDFFPKLMIGELYFYNQRLFCRKSHAIENFIGKVKRYYSDKIRRDYVII